jgi:hypothetical protein
MTTQTEIKVDGIVFDCHWYEDDDGLGNSYVQLDSVHVNGADLTGIISEEWWNMLEEKLTKQLLDDIDDMKLDAELSRLEAYGV